MSEWVDVITVVVGMAVLCCVSFSFGAAWQRKRIRPLIGLVSPVLEAHFDRGVYFALVTYEFHYDENMNENFKATVIAEKSRKESS